MAANDPPPSRRGSLYDDESAPSRRGSLYGDDAPPPPRRGSLYSDDYAPDSRRGSVYGEETHPGSRRGSLYADETAPASRRSSLYGDEVPNFTEQSTTEESVPSRRSSLIGMPPPPIDTTPPPPTEENTNEDRAAKQRKRTERLHGCESMFSLDQIFSRDLRITGVSKKGSSWRYHIEVLDIRGSLMPFTDTFTSTSTPSSSALPSPASSSFASLQDLPAPRSNLPPVVRYSVMRRYNDFRQLYMYLLETLDQEVLEALPKFPDGGLFSYFRGDDPKLLQYRKEQLQRFLRALDELEDTKWCRAFRTFLNPEIDELTTIGGSFAASVEAAPSSTQAWSDSGLSRINANSGYVSLSHVKSPEIRFKKQATDGRGDWKRRKIASANRRPVDESSSRVKSLEQALEKEAENPSDTGDEDEDSDSEQARKPYSELLKLLSLDPNQQQQQQQ